MMLGPISASGFVEAPIPKPVFFPRRSSSVLGPHYLVRDIRGLKKHAARLGRDGSDRSTLSRQVGNVTIRVTDARFG